MNQSSFVFSFLSFIVSSFLLILFCYYFIYHLICCNTSGVCVLAIEMRCILKFLLKKTFYEIHFKPK